MVLLINSGVFIHCYAVVIQYKRRQMNDYQDNANNFEM